MKHKIELVSEYSSTYNERRLYIKVDGAYSHDPTSFRESDMAEALQKLKDIEMKLREGDKVLHVIEIE